MVIVLSFRVDAAPRRCPLKTSHNNQQMLLEKCEESGFEGQANRANQMAKGRVGKFVRKPLPQEKN